MADFSFNIHIRVEKSKGRKLITKVEGIPKEFDYKKMLKYWRKEFKCGGTITVNEEDLSEYIRLTGDQRENVAKFLEFEGIALKDNIHIHGI